MTNSNVYFESGKGEMLEWRIPWKEGSLRVLEAMSLAATLPQLPLPTTVTLDLI